MSCPDAINVNSGNLVYSDQGFIWVRNGAPIVAPPPNPAVLAQQAAGQMTAPNPVIHTGPDPTKLAVKVPVWLWIDTPAPMRLVVAVPRMTVTVTATLTSTTWSAGEPINPANPTSKVPTFTCTRTGTPAPANPAPKTTPPCGYTYIWKSLTNRTAGSGTWPLTATTNWTVTWTASDGTGATLPQPLTPTTTQQVAIGEWRSSLVANPGG